MFVLIETLTLALIWIPNLNLSTFIEIKQMYSIISFYFNYFLGENMIVGFYSFINMYTISVKIKKDNQSNYFKLVKFQIYQNVSFM